MFPTPLPFLIFSHLPAPALVTSVSHRDHFYPQNSFTARIDCRCLEAAGASPSTGRFAVGADCKDLGPSGRSNEIEGRDSNGCRANSSLACPF